MAGALQTDTTIKFYESEVVSGTFISDIIDVQQMEGYSFQLIWSGDMGFKADATIETSNDLTHNVNKIFSTMKKSDQELREASGTHLYEVDSFHHRYMRLKIIVSNNSSTFDIYFNSRSRRN